MSLKRFFGLLFARFVVSKNKRWKENPILSQKNVFSSLIKSGLTTRFGKNHKFDKIGSYEDFKSFVPIRNYEEIKEYIDCIIDGQENILWPGKPIYFCKTSGITIVPSSA